MQNEHRILLVDDDQEFSDLLCRQLLKSGYQVTALTHPRQALEAASLCDYEVAILDRNQPEIEYLRLMRMLTASIGHLQVVIIADHDDPEDKDLALAAGAFAYLAKRCDLSVVENAIESAIESRYDQILEASSHAVVLRHPVHLVD